MLELLTSFVARRPLLILATWQDGGLDLPLHEAEFDRLMGRCEIALSRLRGLNGAATAALIQNVAGAPPSTALVDSVERRTGGNPFYITELTRMLRDSGRLSDSSFGADDVPDAVAGVIRRRMAELPMPTRAALTVAALLGGEFSVDIAAEVLGRPRRRTHRRPARGGTLRTDCQRRAPANAVRPRPGS
ncbi:hypothetical protein [Mycolicibacterium insubricum]|uniref:hypothetical protein n=1 Tax=Mycolicibacterium insubricum TaxID=444597 RepID=UPI0021F33F97|nr:hypothetical protein [Mycolicibacterium insubricum]MCV7082879.1 hypothetical protein [Mycolicibacterium insubricum]